jgi:DNA-binding SARP family transcriptional activator
MEFEVLGPLRVRSSEGTVDVGGARQRRLLGVLVANANHVVSTDRLIEVVFEGDPPPGATNTIRSYVARLRRSLAGNDDASGDLIVTEAPGYRLHVEDHDIDAQRFAAAIDTARRMLQERDAIDAVAALREGLDLWRGEAYDEFAHEEWAHLEAVRLAELRTVAEEELNEALLACGLTHDVVSEARRLVEEHPLRERIRIQLALALYRAGRQVEALRSLEDYERLLAETGLEPSDEVRALERSVAAHDPALRLEAPSGRALRGYRLGEEIGAGRHGVVYRAVQPGVGREVAIKAIRPELADEPEFIRSFDAEAQLVA